MKVLIVDDEPYMIEYIKKLVDWESYGFDQVITAKGGSIASKLLEEHHPELLITDIKMPKISGLDLSKSVQDNHKLTKVIIISGYSEFEYAQQAIRYGVSEYLVKPVLRTEFEESLGRILRQIHDNINEESLVKGVPYEQRDVITSVKNYIWENYGENLSLDRLGDIVHLHPAYLSKMFKEVTNVNLSNYITDVRMQRAAQLLEKKELRIHEVMEKVGYQKDQYFSKLFKEKYKVTPNEYRRNMQ